MLNLTQPNAHLKFVLSITAFCGAVQLSTITLYGPVPVLKT